MYVRAWCRKLNGVSRTERHIIHPCTTGYAPRNTETHITMKLSPADMCAPQKTFGAARHTGQERFHDDLAADVISQHGPVGGHEEVHRLQDVDVHLSAARTETDTENRKSKSKSKLNRNLNPTETETEKLKLNRNLNFNPTENENKDENETETELQKQWS